MQQSIVQEDGCVFDVAETLVGVEMETIGVSSLPHLVCFLPKVVVWQFNWAWSKVGDVLACVETEMRKEAFDGILDG